MKATRCPISTSCIFAVMKNFLIPVFLFWSITSLSQPSQNLNRNWEFFYRDAWHKTDAPFSIHTDLLNHHFIPDPFYADNESQLGWIDSSRWKYRKLFRVEDKLKSFKNIDLIFEGVDTYADVFLNGNRILQAGNMFRPYRADVKKLLKEDNLIEIVFHPAALIADSLYRNYPIKNLPGNSPVMARKAQYHFGWDFAPRFVTCGLWQGVKLEAYNNFTVPYLSVLNDSVTGQTAYLRAAVTFISKEDMPIVISGSLLSGSRVLYSEVQCGNGENTVFIPFTLKNPELWWCNGEGLQPLYEFHFDLTGTNGQSIVQRVKTGLRTVRLIQEKDSAGSSFYFSLNGRPVFMKGANYVPQDVFLNRVTDDQYRSLLTDVKNCGMNMLRVWGGGVYEKKIFYDLADSLGILIWQDFMFACGMYPVDDAFIGNIKSEARHQVLRLNGHPSLALWCGNNEVSEGWHRWGWQNDYSTAERENLWIGYQSVFNNALPAAVNQFSNLGYHESSPTFGRGDSLHTRMGDAHNWFVWHDEAPFSNYEKLVPRFMSEFGFQSLPVMETINSFGGAGELNNAALRSHQKHHRGFAIINKYMLRQFGKIPVSLDQYISLSQQLQAEGMATGIRAHLKAKPFCMGSLLWQLNDCWPGISWSMIDYYGRKKEVYFKVQELFTGK